jgi:hypothetical protein
VEEEVLHQMTSASLAANTVTGKKIEHKSSCYLIWNTTLADLVDEIVVAHTLILATMSSDDVFKMLRSKDFSQKGLIKISRDHQNKVLI